MTGLLSRYLTRLFLTRFAVVLIALVGLVTLLDVLANSDEVVEAGGGTAASLGRYTLLRLPSVLSQVIPISVLLATLITLAGLARHSELAALFAAGVSNVRLVLILMPGVLMVAVAQFVIEDWALPRAIGELRAWGVGDFKDRDSSDGGQMIWFRQGDNLMRVRRTWNDDQTLVGVTIFRRDPDGRLVEMIEAARAIYADGAWNLERVKRTPTASGQPIELARLTWPGAIDGTILRSLSLHPRELPWSEVARLAERSGYGNRPLYLYEVWMHKKIARPVATILLLLLGLAAVQLVHLRGHASVMFVIGIAIGFVYWIFDGLVVTIGESGLLPSVLAAWIPPVVLASLAGTIILRHDGK